MNQRFYYDFLILAGGPRRGARGYFVITQMCSHKSHVCRLRDDVRKYLDELEQKTGLFYNILDVGPSGDFDQRIAVYQAQGLMLEH